MEKKADSFLYSEDLKQIRLAPAYDIVCTLLYGVVKEMAFFIGGESDINKMNRDTFCKAAKEVGLGTKLAMKHFDTIVSSFERAVCETAEELQKSGCVGTENMKAFLLKRVQTILSR